jgi:membrane-associated phospholipid phosphatase
LRRGPEAFRGFFFSCVVLCPGFSTSHKKNLRSSANGDDLSYNSTAVRSFKTFPAQSRFASVCVSLLFLWLSPCLRALAQDSPASSAPDQSFDVVASDAAASDGQAGNLQAGDPAGGAGPSDPSDAICGPHHLRRCLSDIAHDQAGLWTSPLRIRPHDALWLAPAAVVTAVAFRTDLDNSQDWGSASSTASAKLSDIGSGYSTVGFSAGLYFLGMWKHYPHMQETGRLGLEAVIDAALVGEGLKLATDRERPGRGNGKGEFWAHGWTGAESSSFPSGHAITIWALAHEIAAEYPRPWIEISAYAAAATVSYVRVGGQQHYSSDVVVGSVLGYLIGGYVVHHHGTDPPAYALVPMASPAAHAYGMRVELNPSALAAQNVLRTLHLAPRTATP